MLFTLPVFVFWIPYSCYVVWHRPARRHLQAIKLALWLLVLGGACGLHWYYAASARSAANDVVKMVLTYKEQHGSYPAHLKDVSAALGNTGGTWGIGYVVDERNTHALIYPATFTVFDAYIYEFENGDWMYISD